MTYRSDYYDNDNYDPYANDTRCGYCPHCDGEVFRPEPADDGSFKYNGLREDSETAGDCPYCRERVVFIPYVEGEAYDLANEHPVHNWLRWSYAIGDDETRSSYTIWVARQIALEGGQAA